MFQAVTDTLSGRKDARHPPSEDQLQHRHYVERGMEMTRQHFARIAELMGGTDLRFAPRGKGCHGASTPMRATWASTP